jgi:hypothetical protein
MKTCEQCLKHYRPHRETGINGQSRYLGTGRRFCSWRCYRASQHDGDRLYTHAELLEEDRLRRGELSDFVESL